MLICAFHSITHIIHVPNLQDRTTVFAVESDLDFISGPATITIGRYSLYEVSLNCKYLLTCGVY